MNEADLQNSILMSWKSLPLNEKKHYVELSELESNRFGSEFDDSPQRQYVFYFKFHFKFHFKSPYNEGCRVIIAAALFTYAGDVPKGTHSFF